MKLMMFGQTGQVATEVQRQADVIALGRDVADLSDMDALRAAIHRHQPDVVINAAAYTAVDRAEEEETFALARRLGRRQTALIHRTPMDVRNMLAKLPCARRVVITRSCALLGCSQPMVQIS